MKINKTTLLILVLAVLSGNLYSQTGEIKRISLSEDQGTGGIINLYDIGLAIKTTEKSEVVLTFYNESLKKGTITKFALQGRKEGVFNSYYDTIVKKILIFHGTKKTNNLTLVSPDGKKKQTVELIIPGKKALLNTNFIKIDKTTFAIITAKKGKTSLNTVELKNGDIQPVELPEEWNTRNIIKMSRVNSKYLAVFYIDRKVKNKKFRNVALIDDNGEVAVDKLLTNKETDFSIEEFSITDLGNDELAIAGTYGTTVTSVYSVGMFIAKIENLKLRYIKYFDYNKIKNFYNFMTEKSKEKAEKKAKRAASSGKSTKYLAVTHPVIMVDEKLLITAEFYYPTYRTESYTSYSNGRATTSYRTVFDGYQYTHTMVLGVDADGKKEFEHCIPLKLDFKPFYASQKLKRRISNDEVKYSYIAFNKIHSFSLADGKIIENPTKTLVEVESDKKLKANYNSIDSWYDNFFYALSSQTTKEKGKIVGGKSTHYTLIKLAVD